VLSAPTSLGTGSAERERAHSWYMMESHFME
jgi:hypothetical protein